MEKRRLTSLRSVLLQYLVRTALTCLLVAVGWLLVLMLWIQNSGLFLPANQAAQACQKAAQEVLPGMTAENFDETQLDSLCRYALFAAPDSSEVLATNMDAGYLQRAMENLMASTVFNTRSPPSFIKRSYTISTLSVSAIGTFT